MATFGKSIAAVIYAALVILYQALSGDNLVDRGEFLQILIAVATAVGVYLVPMAPRYRWAKTAVAVILTALQAASAGLLGGWETNDWLMIVLAIGGALGIGIAPATSENPAGTGDVVVGVGADR